MISPEILLTAYCRGYFPMADPDDGDRISWYAPDPRAILPLDRLHVSKSLQRTIRKGLFSVRVDESFETVIRECAAPDVGRETTWISDEIIASYSALHQLGFAHSVECWLDDKLVGGLYGVAAGGAFFGESMFSRVTDASKVALVHLVERLRAGGFVLLDTQMTTPHLAQFGATTIPRESYEKRLKQAISIEADWNLIDADN